MSGESLADRAAGAMQRLAKSVTIVTTTDGRARHASPATAVTNLTDEPPTLALCMKTASGMHALLEPGRGFVVNVLAATQRDVLEACMKARGEERFAAGRWAEAEGGLPLLEGSQASFVCRQAARFEHGTHAIFVGEVVDVKVAGDVDPLIYAGGDFRALTPR